MTHTRGSMLLLAMALITTAVVLAFAFVIAMRGERDSASGAIGQQQARIAAEQGVAHAQRILIDDYLRNPSLPTTMHGSWRTHVAPINATTNPWNFSTKDTTYYPAMGASLSPGDRGEMDVKCENDLLAPLSGQVEMGQYVGTGQVLAGQIGVTQNNGMARWFEPGAFYESYTLGSDTARCVTPFDVNYVTPDEAAGTESAAGVPKLDKTGAVVSTVSIPSVRALYFDAQWQPVLFRHQAVYRLRYALMLEDLQGHLGISPQGSYLADRNGTLAGTNDEVDLALASRYSPSLRAMGSFTHDQIRIRGESIWPSWLGLGWAPWEQSIAFARTTSAYQSPTPFANFRNGETIRLARSGENLATYERVAESWDNGNNPGREVGLAWNWQGNSGVRTGVWRGTSGVHHGWGQAVTATKGSGDASTGDTPAIESVAWWQYTPFARPAKDPLAANASNAWDAGRCATPWKINLLTATAATLRSMTNGLVSVRAKDVGVTQEDLEHDDDASPPSATSLNENWVVKNSVTITVSDDQMIPAGSDLWTKKFDATLFAGYDGVVKVYPDANGNGKWLPRNNPTTSLTLADDDRKDWTNTEGQYLPLEYRLSGRGHPYWFAGSRGLGFKSGSDQPSGWPCSFDSTDGGQPDAFNYDPDPAGNTPKYRINQLGLPEWGFNGPPLGWWMTHTVAGYGSPVTPGNVAFPAYAGDPDKGRWRAKLGGTHLRHVYSYFWDLETATEASLTMARWQWDPYNSANTLGGTRPAPNTDQNGDGILDSWPTSPFDGASSGRRFELQDVDRNMLFLLGEAPAGEGANGQQVPGARNARPHLMHGPVPMGTFAFKPRINFDRRPSYTTGSSWDDPQGAERPAFLRFWVPAGPVMGTSAPLASGTWPAPDEKATKLGNVATTLSTYALPAITYPGLVTVGQAYNAARVNISGAQVNGNSGSNTTWPFLNIRGMMLGMLYAVEEFDPRAPANGDVPTIDALPAPGPKCFRFAPDRATMDFTTDSSGNWTDFTPWGLNTLPWLIFPWTQNDTAGHVSTGNPALLATAPPASQPTLAGIAIPNEIQKQKVQLRSLNYRRARLMELALNDWRLSLFGSSRDYVDFRPLDFDGDGYAMCSAYAKMSDADVSTYAQLPGTTLRPARHLTWRDSDNDMVYDPGVDALEPDLRSAPSDCGTIPGSQTYPRYQMVNFDYPSSVLGTGRGPAIKAGAHFSLTGQFTMGNRFAERKSHLWRVIVRGQVFNELSGSVVAEANKEVVLALDPDGDCYVPTGVDAATGSVVMTPAGGNGLADTTTLYQRWFDNGYRALRQPVR